MTRALASGLAALLLGAACGPAPIVIDGRRDGGADAAAPTDGGGDGGCAPPGPAAWVPIDTMGPADEPLADCIERVGSRTDPRAPEDQRYDLTTFGGAGDAQPVACSGAADADGSWYYAAGSQRLPCGQRVRVVDAARRQCVILQVADFGPSACVEEAGGRPIWDASPLAAQHLFGVQSVGWSEHREVFGAPVGTDNALGPCDAQLERPRDFLRGFIGGPCDSPGDCSYTDGVCLRAADGWPGGVCSLGCDTSCPDRAGPYAYTACVPLEDGTRRCLPRCDYTLFATGCRDGYGCEARPSPSGSARRVCVPIDCE